MEDKEYKKLYSHLHSEACKAGKDSYRDPKTGYLVFTAVYHKRRGYCCKSGCRHCAYGYVLPGRNS